MKLITMFLAAAMCPAPGLAQELESVNAAEVAELSRAAEIRVPEVKAARPAQNELAYAGLATAAIMDKFLQEVAQAESSGSLSPAQFPVMYGRALEFYRKNAAPAPSDEAYETVVHLAESAIRLFELGAAASGGDMERFQELVQTPFDRLAEVIGAGSLKAMRAGADAVVSDFAAQLGVRKAAEPRDILSNVPACSILSAAFPAPPAPAKALRLLSPCLEHVSGKYGVRVSASYGLMPYPEVIAHGLVLKIHAPVPAGNTIFADLSYSVARRGTLMLYNASVQVAR